MEKKRQQRKVKREKEKIKKREFEVKKQEEEAKQRFLNLNDKEKVYFFDIKNGNIKIKKLFFFFFYRGH